MELTNAQRAALAAALFAIVGGIAAGTISLQHPEQTRTHVKVAWDGGVPNGCICERATIVGPSMTWSVLGLDEMVDSDGGIVPSYARAEIRVDSSDDAGTAALLPPGIEVVEREACSCSPDSPRLEVWRVDDPGAPLSCACAPSDPDAGICEWCWPQAEGPCQWGAAPHGLTMQPGEFRGACIKKLCVESSIDGFGPGSSLPGGCR